MNKLEAQEPGEILGFSAFHHCDKISKWLRGGKVYFGSWF
jgi:hypothetical protein